VLDSCKPFQRRSAASQQSCVDQLAEALLRPSAYPTNHFEKNARYAMRTLDTSDIKAPEIDGLGHMNVRYYMERAQRANRVLLKELGLKDLAKGDIRLIQPDSYTRYHREQFVGSTLTVNGGVLSADARELSAFFELTNPAKGQIAATFILVTSLIDGATGETIAIPAAIRAAANAQAVELPEYGRPRTIDMATPRTDLAYEIVAARLADDPSDPMGRKTEWTVPAEACDAHGFMIDNSAMMFGGPRGPAPAEREERAPGERGGEGMGRGPMTFRGDEGHRLGWASLETRNVRVSQARAGDVLCSVGAEIGLHAKVRHSRRWLFNVTSGQLVSLNDNVAIALDLDARRPIDIPQTIRTQLEARHVPEFA
jgi:acyl-CoA thioester hydrolase